MKPVYCPDCKWFEIHTSDTGSCQTCLHPSNVRTAQTHMGPVVETKYTPEEANGNATCEAYEATPQQKGKLDSLTNLLDKVRGL